MAKKPAQVSQFSSLLISDVVLTDTELGRGADATVYAVEWNGTTCAAKRLHKILLEDASPEGVDRLIGNFEQECLTWSKLSDPAVVQFLGVYFEPRCRLPVLIMEKMDTSLRKYLEGHSKDEFPLHFKAFVLRQVIQALAYLHEQKPPLVHHDLSPNNVLLDEKSFMAKVTDFGMSRAVNPSILTRKSSIKGTLAFMAPEALQNPPRYNEKLDIFSFGNIILSILTHEWPEPDPPTFLKGSKIVGRSELQRRERYCELFTAEEKKLYSPIVQRCLQNAPDKRPSSAVLLQELQYIKESLTPVVQTSQAEDEVQQKTTETGVVKFFKDLTKRRSQIYIVDARSEAEDTRTTVTEKEPNSDHRVAGVAKDIDTTFRDDMTARKLQSKGKQTYFFKVVIVGDVSGKSSLVDRFICNEFSYNPVPTIGLHFRIKSVEVDSKEIKVRIWDTGGQDRYHDITRMYCRGADGCLIVYDITNHSSYVGATGRLKTVRDRTHPDTPIMLVGNKCDLKHRREVSTHEAKAYAEENSMMFMETSAWDGTNVKAAFLNLVTEIYQVKNSLGQLYQCSARKAL